MASASWNWDGTSEGEARRLLAHCPSLGHPHHRGHSLQFRVGLPRPSVSCGVDRRGWPTLYPPRGLKTYNRAHRCDTQCFVASGGEGFARLSRRCSGRCLLICLLWGRGPSKIGPTQLEWSFTLETRGCVVKREGRTMVNLVLQLQLLCRGFNSWYGKCFSSL